MKCIFCGAELEEGVQICPVCGKCPEEPVERSDAQEETLQEQAAEPAQEQPEEQAETPEAEAAEEKVPEEEVPAAVLPQKPRKRWKTAVAILCAAALLWGSLAGAWYWINGGWLPSESSLLHSTLVKLAANNVVATVGDQKLTNEQLQVHYWMQLYNIISYYGDSSMVDLEIPLSEQQVPGLEGEEAQSWEQYLLELALENWHQYQVLAQEAEKAGMTMPEDYEAYVQALPENMGKQAKELGYKDLEDYLHTMMGPGATKEAYVAYMDLSNRAEYYFSTALLKEEPTREEVSAYFDKYAEEFSNQYGVTKETGKLVDVRHILIKPEGATADTNGIITATDDQWENCRQEAQALLDEWKKDGSEAAFAALANEKSTDGGSNTNGGLYSGVPKGYMVTNFDAWIFEEGRKAGDTGLVRTEFGYHIMYYCGGEEAWYLYGLDLLLSDLRIEKLNALVEATPMETNYDAVVLGRAQLEKMNEA